MMSSAQDKKPDNVVYNAKTERYDASLKEYATNLGAPVITTNDTVAWKNRNIHEVNAQFESRFDEIKNAYQKLAKEFEYNKLIYTSDFSFEPIIGKIYHLYRKNRKTTFLSIIAPNECNFDFMGSFYLNNDKMWIKQ